MAAAEFDSIFAAAATGREATNRRVKAVPQPRRAEHATGPGPGR